MKKMALYGPTGCGTRLIDAPVYPSLGFLNNRRHSSPQGLLPSIPWGKPFHFADEQPFQVGDRVCGGDDSSLVI